MIAPALFGASLVAIGVVGYYGSARASKTALIPAALGAPVLLLSMVGIGAPSVAVAARGLGVGAAVIGLVATRKALMPGAASSAAPAAARRAKIATAIASLALLGSEVVRVTTS